MDTYQGSDTRIRLMNPSTCAVSLEHFHISWPRKGLGCQPGYTWMVAPEINKT